MQQSNYKLIKNNIPYEVDYPVYNSEEEPKFQNKKTKEKAIPKSGKKKKSPIEEHERKFKEKKIKRKPIDRNLFNGIESRNSKKK